MVFIHTRSSIYQIPLSILLSNLLSCLFCCVGGWNSWARSTYWCQSPVTGQWSWEPEVTEIAYNYIPPQLGKIVDNDGTKNRDLLHFNTD